MALPPCCASTLSMRRPSISTISNRQPSDLDLVADIGDRAELLQQEAGKGLVGPRRGQRDAEQVGEFERRHPARDQIGAVVALDVSRLGRALPRCGRRRRSPPEYRRWSPRPGTRRTRRGPGPICTGGIAQDRDHVARIERFGNDRRVADQLADVRRPSGQIDVEHVLGLHDAERMSRSPSKTDRSESDCSSAERGMDLRPGSARSIMLTSCRGVMTAPTGRSPSRITPAIISFSPGSSTPAFSASTTSVRISSSLTLLFGFAAMAEQPEQRLAGTIEQPHQRQRDLRHQHHRRRDLDRDRFGIAQRDLLRHQFADDQRGIGDDADDEADADGVGEALRQAELRAANASGAVRAWRRRTRPTARRSA